MGIDEEVLRVGSVAFPAIGFRANHRVHVIECWSWQVVQTTYGTFAALTGSIGMRTLEQNRRP